MEGGDVEAVVDPDGSPEFGTYGSLCVSSSRRPRIRTGSPMFVVYSWHHHHNRETVTDYTVGARMSSGDDLVTNDMPWPGQNIETALFLHQALFRIIETDLAAGLWRAFVASILTYSHATSRPIWNNRSMVASYLMID